MSAELSADAATVTAVRSPFGFRFVAPLALGTSLNPINSTMIATAAVPIALSLHATAADVGWLIAGLYLASAIAQPTMGRLADLYGARRVYLVALGFVALAGVLGGFAPTLLSLVFVRVLLGIGTSGAYPAAMRIFRVQADGIGAEPPRAAMSFLSLTAQTTAAAGPVLGGALASTFGWHAIFTVNVPLALVTATLVLLWTPKDAPVARSPAGLLDEIDFAGMALFAITVVCTMIFLMNLRHPTVLALAGAIAFGIALVAYSLRRERPFIDVRLLRNNRPLSMTYIRTGIVLLVVYGIIYGFAQWLEGAAGFSGTEAGLLMLPLFVVGAVSSLVGGRMSGIRAPFIISVAAATGGCALLFYLHTGTPAWLVACAAAVCGLPMGLFSTATQAAIYIQAPREAVGTAAGLQRTASNLGAIGATSVIGLLYGARATDAGFHNVVLCMGTLSALLLAFTFFDRTIPRGKL